MRFFLGLVAVLAGILEAQILHEPLGTTIKFPSGLPDGAIITFYFWHKGDGGKDPVAIAFYDVEEVKSWKDQDIPAHLRLEHDWYYPVMSSYYTKEANGQWHDETWRVQPLDVVWTNGYWRVDMIKHDEHRMNVFFQGFWSDVRTFSKSLNNIRSVYVFDSKFLDTKLVQIHLTMPNKYLVPLSFDQAQSFLQDGSMSDRKLVSFASFPIGAQLNMIAVLRASGGAKYHTPSLVFAPAGGTPAFFMKILQIWRDVSGFDWRETQELHITSTDVWKDERPEGTQCTSWEMRPNGDLLHLSLERISNNSVKLRIYYKTISSISAGRDVLSCVHNIPPALAIHMDQPFDIISHDGAFFFHIDHTLPRVQRMIGGGVRDNRVPRRIMKKSKKIFE